MILDIQLPVLDGFSLLKKLKGENIKYPKTIIVSAFAMDKDKQTAKMLGCENYITKPIDIMNVLATVEKLANYLTYQIPYVFSGSCTHRSLNICSHRVLWFLLLLHGCTRL